MADTAVRNYILVFSNSAGNLEDIKNFINSRDEIITWYICMSNAVFIRSRLNATGLQIMFREFTQDSGRFIVMDCDTDRNGWLPRKAWQFMRNEYL